VKEYYFYLDSTPTHCMKWLYKYPQAAFPYASLIETNRRRTRQEFEYELLDTGVFDRDRYFDVFAEYAKESPEDILIRITVANRGPEKAMIHLLPTLWLRNTWSWWPDAGKHSLAEAKGQNGASIVSVSQAQLGERWLYCEGPPALLFTENETNNERLYGKPNASPYVKDAFHAFVVQGRKDAVNPAQAGTKTAAHYQLEVNAGDSVVVRLRLTDAEALADPFGAFEKTFEAGPVRPMSSTARSRPLFERGRCASCGRPMQGCSGQSMHISWRLTRGSRNTEWIPSSRTPSCAQPRMAPYGQR
jgi:hypothetical protein